MQLREWEEGGLCSSNWLNIHKANLKMTQQPPKSAQATFSAWPTADQSVVENVWSLYSFVLQLRKVGLFDDGRA